MRNPVALIEGLILPGSRSIGVVRLFASEVWFVGRYDPGYLRSSEWADRHLAVPTPRPDLSVHHLTLRAGQRDVELSSPRGAPVLINNYVRSTPVTLTTGTAFIRPTISGLHSEFLVKVLAIDDYPDVKTPAPSGTTVALRIILRPDHPLWLVAHALAWPALPCRLRPTNMGWTGTDVAQRVEELWQGSPRLNELLKDRSSTGINRRLDRLAKRVEDARTLDDRPAALFYQHWPPWEEPVPGPPEDRNRHASRRNRTVAEMLYRAEAVSAEVIDRTQM